MLKADKHLHPNEKLIRLKRNKPFFFGAALMFCDSKVNQTILDLLIKNLIQSRYKMLYRKGGGDYRCLSPEAFWSISYGKCHSSLVLCLMFHSTWRQRVILYWGRKPLLSGKLETFDALKSVENNFSLLLLNCLLSFTRKQKQNTVLL